LAERHQAVGLLFDAEPAGPTPSLAGIRQHGGVSSAEVAGSAMSEFADLAEELPGQPRLLISESLATAWPDSEAEVAPAGQPMTGLWWQLLDDLTDDGPLVVADYDPQLGYLCLAGWA
jgi:hypothetical protein